MVSAGQVVEYSPEDYALNEWTCPALVPLRVLT
jgi:hypothetical protein